MAAEEAAPARSRHDLYKGGEAARLEDPPELPASAKIVSFLQRFHAYHPIDARVGNGNALGGTLNDNHSLAHSVDDRATAYQLQIAVRYIHGKNPGAK